jgi:hypothetical protein
VESGGSSVLGNVGLNALGSFADRLGLGDALSPAIPWRGTGVPPHDRGKVLTQTALTLAGGVESCLDIEHLRIGEDLFGSVPSDTTVARPFHKIDAKTRPHITTALADVRAKGWRKSSVSTGTARVVLDTLAALLCPGNAGANTVPDHVTVLEAAVCRLCPR